MKNYGIMRWAAAACLAAVLISGTVPRAFGAEENGRKSEPRRVYKDVNVDQFDKLRAEKNAVVLDVRTPREFKAGHIPGATNIDWYAKDFQDQVGKLDKNKTYLVHCASGGRSAKASEKMGELKFDKVYNMTGGFNAWQKAGKPVER